MYRMEIFSFKKALAALHRSPLYRHPSSLMWRRCLSIDSQFCDAVVSSGLLSWEQMLHAACRYCLGATRHRGVIFWQIDQEGCIHDGKVMYYREDCHRDKAHHPTWVSTLLQRRYRWDDAERLVSSHCLFGLHLLSFSTHYSPLTIHHSTIAMVESEKSAFILSEWFPQSLWLATGGLGNVQPEKFRPLRGRRVTLFPDTDPDGTTFRRWYEAAQAVMRQPFWEGSPPIRVSALLEIHASDEEKARKIDLVDFLEPSLKGGMEAPNALNGGSKLLEWSRYSSSLDRLVFSG